MAYPKLNQAEQEAVQIVARKLSDDVGLTAYYNGQIFGQGVLKRDFMSAQGNMTYLVQHVPEVMVRASSKTAAQLMLEPYWREITDAYEQIRPLPEGRALTAMFRGSLDDPGNAGSSSHADETISQSMHSLRNGALAGMGYEGNSLTDLLDKNAGIKFTYRYMMKYLSDELKRLLIVANHSDYLIVQILAARHVTGRWNGFFDQDRVTVTREECSDIAPMLMRAMEKVAHVKRVESTPEVKTQTQTNGATNEMEQSTSNNANGATKLKSTKLKGALDAMLGLNDIAQPIDVLLDAYEKMQGADKEKADSEARIRSLEAKLKTALASQTQVASVQTNEATDLPSGTMEYRPAGDVFRVLKGCTFDIPCFTWDAPHPDVQTADPDYTFRKEPLLRALMALTTGDLLWLSGHTGTGKTTLVEQISAATGWPFIRIAMDSSLDRAELVGRAELKSDGKGGTESYWIPGILERSMPNGYIIALDEFDASRPDGAAFVLQPVLEGKELRILEDGGRKIAMHPMTRIVALGNTTGNGDSTNLYPATRVLNAATLDRFTSFVMVDYMTKAEEAAMLCKRTGIDKDVADRIAELASEMRRAFTTGEVPISMSPRRSIAMARSTMAYSAALNKSLAEALPIAVQEKLVNPSPEEFQLRVKEIASNTVGYQGRGSGI